MNHLTELELIKQFESSESLSPEKVEHFSNCSFCQEEYKKQLLVHNKLIKIRPMVVSAKFAQKVLNHLSHLEISYIPKAKTDWFFILAITMLLFVAFWYTFAGNTEFLAGDYLNGIKEYVPEIKKQSVIGYLINQFSELVYYGSKFTYFIIGLISLLIYWILDKYISKSVYIKKINI